MEISPLLSAVTSVPLSLEKTALVASLRIVGVEGESKSQHLRPSLMLIVASHLPF